MKKRGFIYMMSASLIALMLAGCGSSQTAQEQTETTEEQTEETQEQTADTETEEEIPSYSQDVFAMDTYMTLTAYGYYAEDAVKAAVEEINRLDALLSTGNEDSEIAKINAEGGGTLSEDAAYLTERSLELADSTGGAFDIAIYPVMVAWGFPSQEYRVPDDDELAALLELADVSLIDYDSDTKEISFKKDGVEIDLGGIAKGYTSGRIMDIFDEFDCVSGVVSLGGNVQTFRTKTDGSQWRVGIQDPDDESGYVGVLETADRAVITSGGYERYFEQDGVTYHHIIDPSTGYPADSGLKSVTIVSADGTLADGLSTSLFIMGVDKAISYWQDHSGEFDFILMDNDNKIYVSAGIADSFTTDYECEVVDFR